MHHCAVLTQLFVLHPHLRYELQRVVAHTEKLERYPGIESASIHVMEYRAELPCRAHNRQ